MHAGALSEISSVVEHALHRGDELVSSSRMDEESGLTVLDDLVHVSDVGGHHWELAHPRLDKDCRKTLGAAREEHDVGGGKR
jgi:hypothetical protein